MFNYFRGGNKSAFCASVCILQHYGSNSTNLDLLSSSVYHESMHKTEQTGGFNNSQGLQLCALY